MTWRAPTSNGTRSTNGYELLPSLSELVHMYVPCVCSSAHNRLSHPQVAERIAQLQEALLHCGKFQDALEPLLSWLSDTEELVANQKPPSAEYRVVKAQIQEQKVQEGRNKIVFHVLRRY